MHRRRRRPATTPPAARRDRERCRRGFASRPLDCAGSSPAPLPAQVSTISARHFDMALEADVLAQHVSLLRVECIGQHPCRARRQREDVVMPLEGRELVAATEPGGRGRIRYHHLAPADFGCCRRRHRCAERLGKQLPSQAMSDDRDVVGDSLPEQREQRCVPGKRIVRAHRAAHHADAGEGAGIVGDRFALIERDDSMRHAVPLEPLAEVTRPFGRREAENRDGTHGESATRAVTMFHSSSRGAPSMRRILRSPGKSREHR